MTVISLRLADSMLIALEKQARALHVSRTEYVRKALEAMLGNASQAARNQRMAMVSNKVRRESMRVNAEFDRIENDPEV